MRIDKRILCGIAFCLIALYVLDILNIQNSSIINTIEESKTPPSENPLVIWSSDFHISPVADIKYLLAKFNVRFIDKSLSAHCHLTQTCQNDLQIINSENGIDLSSCPNTLRMEFYNYYRRDKEFLNVDAILCTHACSMCELFMPFGKPLIVISSTRYEIGRHDAKRWLQWNANLIKISSHDENTIGANNIYDLEYMKYFTPISNIEYIPSACFYVTSTYEPLLSSYLIGPSRGINELLANDFIDTCGAQGIDVNLIRHFYPTHYEYSDLASHQGVVLFPYQVSFMLFFELYNMNIPIFIPSPTFLIALHMKYNILNERTWNTVFQRPFANSPIPKHAYSTSEMQVDPNNELNLTSIRDWVSLSDFYTFPFVTQFDSFQDFIDMIQPQHDTSMSHTSSNNKYKKVNLTQISLQMMQHNEIRKEDIYNTWMHVISKVIQHKQRKIHQQTSQSLHLRSQSYMYLPYTINEALMKFYDTTLDEKEVKEEAANGCIMHVE